MSQTYLESAWDICMGVQFYVVIIKNRGFMRNTYMRKPAVGAI
jgi:hypothetical protein